ncbi:hypothetical protein OPT61_g217 [Boeremia exigua]|uniref:Uncharacterized protein n=1 Tax=Boeremia exigua TaxID=749465 RepID=A0ACC2IUR7_9PLEO|nr:hypothetical protein OPT61_g217 [Boeremia exigua]
MSADNLLEADVHHEEEIYTTLARALMSPQEQSDEQIEEEDWEADFSESPFPDGTSFIKDNRSSENRWLYIAQSSSWSFVFRVTDMLQEATPEATEGLRFPLDGDAYPLTWDHIRVDESNWLQMIPPQDYAIYLLNSVKFHMSHRLQFFDEKAFSAMTAEFYQNPDKMVRSSRLWFVQFLVILAFGKALLERSRRNVAPPGFEFFARAMSLLPSIPNLQTNEPILGIEVLALIALYLYCLDYRASAYSYIGQAARLAMHSGVHTRLPVERFGVDLAQRYNYLWWSVYILDRHISSTTGCPTVVHEQDITVPLPISLGSSQQNIVSTLHVKVSRLVSKVLSSEFLGEAFLPLRGALMLKAVYVPDNVIDQTFFERTRRLLKSLAGLARELEDTIHSELQGPSQVDLASVAFLTLAYHECAILATRPILLSLLKRRLKGANRSYRSTQNISSRLKTLVDTCAYSAAKVIDLLTIRLENNVIEVFLPFQLETLSSALVVLLIIQAVSFTDHDVPTLEARAHAILDEMIAQSNPIAKYRKAEAVHVGGLLAALHEEIGPMMNEGESSNSAAAIRPSIAVSSESTHLILTSNESASTYGSGFPMQFQSATSSAFPMVLNDDFLLNFGLSSEALDGVANQFFFDSPLGELASWSTNEEPHR